MEYGTSASYILTVLRSHVINSLSGAFFCNLNPHQTLIFNVVPSLRISLMNDTYYITVAVGFKHDFNLVLVSPFTLQNSKHQSHTMIAHTEHNIGPNNVIAIILQAWQLCETELAGTHTLKTFTAPLFAFTSPRTAYVKDTSEVSGEVTVIGFTVCPGPDGSCCFSRRLFFPNPITFTRSRALWRLFVSQRFFYWS